MNDLELTKAIRHLRPTAEFSFKETDYSTIKWDILEGDAPTWEEVQAAHLEVKAAEETKAAEAAVARAALLSKLGITEEEAKLLLGGN
jgi:hypothetical protein